MIDSILLDVHVGLIPFGMSGLKSYYHRLYPIYIVSHPVWDEWIEMTHCKAIISPFRNRLIPFGMSGLK